MRLDLKRFLLAGIASVLLLAACQQAPVTNNAPEAEPDPEAEPEPEADPEAEAFVEGGEEGGGELVIYSGRSESLVDPIIQEFARLSGIDVQVRYGGTAEVAATLMEEGENSPADIFYAQDPGGLGAVQEAGMLAELPQEILDRVPSRFQPASGEWVGISGRARVVVYNTEAITDPENELPNDLWGFTEPEWQARIGWAPTNGSFQAMVTAMRTVWGEERTAEWLEGIQANDPIVYEGNTPIVAATAAGEVDVGFVNHYYLYRFIAEEGEGFGARNYFLPGGGPGSLIMVSGAGILETAENRENAEQFLEFLLSVPGQQYFASQTYEYPVVEGVQPSLLLPPLEELDQQAVDIEPVAMSDLEGTVQLLSDLGVLP
ncbi:MAG: iron ABC transporter substrate-binding protein [Candidatus Promineifilaceae bacterium]|nr:iron ABC transporter substrate-binding protein [Candidatus Promineifilaceae bacterium]